MTGLSTQKRIAADILGISKDRVWLNPEAKEEISQAMTREDVRELIEKKAIQEKPAKKPSKKIAKLRKAKKAKRKGVGHGKRKGTASARKSKKEKWMEKIRALRKFLKQLKDKKLITDTVYRRYYLQSKGGRFTSLRHLKDTLKYETKKKDGKGT